MTRATKIALGLGLLVLGAGLLLYLMLDIYIAATGAMEPTIARNERLVAQARLMGQPHHGDIVIAQIPGEPKPRISRVVAVAGDTIEGRDGVVWLDGERLVEPYVASGVITSPFPAVTVPPDHVYLLSDNRPLGKDSRVFGPVSGDDVVGRVVLRLWPIGGI